MTYIHSRTETWRDQLVEHLSVGDDAASDPATVPYRRALRDLVEYCDWLTQVKDRAAFRPLIAEELIGQTHRALFGSYTVQSGDER